MVKIAAFLVIIALKCANKYVIIITANFSNTHLEAKK